MTEKSKLVLLTGLLLSAGTSLSTGHPNPKPQNPEEIDLLKREYLKKKGVKQWNIDGIIVWARDEKNAKRKAENIKKQNNKL
jgi:hypothetical protein